LSKKTILMAVTFPVAEIIEFYLFTNIFCGDVLGSMVFESWSHRAGSLKYIP
jgi:hypothetical protein